MDYGFIVGTGLLLIGAIVWLVCVYYCYRQAQERGRRPWLWGVLGFFFGPFALFAVVVLPRGR